MDVTHVGTSCIHYWKVATTAKHGNIIYFNPLIYHHALWKAVYVPQTLYYCFSDDEFILSTDVYDNLCAEARDQLLYCKEGDKQVESNCGNAMDANYTDKIGHL